MIERLWKEKQYRIVLCVSLAVVGLLFFVSGSLMSALLEMDPMICNMMSTQLVGVGFFTAAVLMTRYLQGQSPRTAIVEAFCEASFFSGIVLAFNLQYANVVLVFALVCATVIFLRCVWWFFKQTDIDL